MIEHQTSASKGKPTEAQVRRAAEFGAAGWWAHQEGLARMRKQAVVSGQLSVGGEDKTEKQGTEKAEGTA